MSDISMKPMVTVGSFEDLTTYEWYFDS